MSKVYLVCCEVDLGYHVEYVFQDFDTAHNYCEETKSTWFKTHGYEVKYFVQVAEFIGEKK